MSSDSSEKNKSNYGIRLSASRAKDEIDSWRPYVEALREEDRLVFREMINSVSASYAEAIERAERGYDTESLLMSIILNQQKTITWLSGLVRKIQDQAGTST
jgi:hypothetical protein